MKKDLRNYESEKKLKRKSSINWLDLAEDILELILECVIDAIT